MDNDNFDALTEADLRAHARAAGVHRADTMPRHELVVALRDTDEAMTRSEERLVAGTEVYEIGRARLRKYVVTEQVQITVQVRREELRLERVPIVGGEHMLVEDPDVFGTLEQFGGPEGGVIFDVVLHEERPVITTEIVPVERVRLSKLVHTEQHISSGQVRKERIEAEWPGQSPTILD